MTREHIGGGALSPDSDVYWQDAHRIVDEVTEVFGLRSITLMDRISRWWLTRQDSPYLDEMDQFAEQLGRPGVHFLNLSLEWACTVSLFAAPGGGTVLRRTFDWGPVSLGPTLRVIERSDALPYTALTWPIFAGEVTVIAPGRFALSLNHAPGPGAWLINRLKFERLGRLMNTLSFLPSKATPPVQLLRKIAQTAKSAQEAKAMLLSEKLCRSAIFALAAPDIADSGIVERHYTDKAVFRPAPTNAANHFQDLPGASYPESVSRAMAICDFGPDAPMDTWCRPPVLNDLTRFASVIHMPSGAHETVSFLDGKPVSAATSNT